MNLASLFNVKGLLMAGSVSLAVGLIAGGIAGHKVTAWKKDAEISDINRKIAERGAASAKTAFALAQRQTVTSNRIGQAAAETDANIETIYRTLHEKVKIYVPVKTAVGVIGANDRVPLGAILLLDKAARGDASDGVSFANGQSYDTGTDLNFAALIDNTTANYGLANRNAAQLNALIDWTRAQAALNEPSIIP